MADMTQPQLGYGKPTEASINTVNQWMRSSPWYQQLLMSWGQDPNNVHLNDQQKQQVMRAAQAQGVVVDEGDMEVDPSGNFNPKGHKLRNTLIVAGLAGATIATMGAVGAFAGAGGAAGAGADAAATAIPGISMASTPAVLGETAAGSLGAIGTAAGGSGSTLATIAGAAGKSGLSQAGDLLRYGANGIAGATDAAGNNRAMQEQAGLAANGQNIAGQNAFENQLMNRATLEAQQRKSALKDSYRQSYMANPRVSPFDPAGAPQYSDAYRNTTNNLAGQGNALLAKGPTYGPDGMPILRPYNPIDIRNVQGATGTQKGTLEKIGDWAGPGMSTTAGILKLLGRS